MAIDYEELQRIIRETDASYAAGNAAQRQEAVARRDAAINQWSNAMTIAEPVTEYRGAGASSPSPPTPAPTPIVWFTTPTYTEPGVKQADPDIIIDPEVNTSGDYIVERFFEELGGTELISISRYDLIDGIDVSYRPIANLSRLRQRFNPNNIIFSDNISQNQFSKFAIDLISRGIYEPYFNDNGDLVVEIDIIRSEENIDVQFSESGTVTRIEL